MVPGMETYWNHNTAFHHELVADAKTRGGRVLDVGCGEGLLLERLAPVARHIVGIDPDAKAIERARARLKSSPNATLLCGDFLAMPVPSPEERYSTITCVAALHHMELKAALLRMRQLLAPGGRLLVVGLAANRTVADFVLSGLQVLPVRIMNRWHGGVREIGVRLAAPQQSLRDIRQAAQEVLPGAKIRRRFYYRYLLSWDKPPSDL